MIKKCLLTLLVIWGSILSSQAQCTSPNTAFKDGEQLSYDLYFNWKFIWFKVGTAYWDIQQVKYGNQPAYRADLITKGSKRADRYFVMRDTLATYTTLNLTPLYFEKNAVEGKQYRREKVWYTYSGGQCHLKMFYQRDQLEPQNKQYSSKYCAFDMLAMMLRARSFNPQKYKKGYRQKFLMAEGRKAEWRILEYQGKETVKMRNTNDEYRCLVFSYLENDNGKEKAIVTFYITDDANHLPVKLDLRLNFGSAQAFINSYKGLRNPMTARISR